MQETVPSSQQLELQEQLASPLVALWLVEKVSFPLEETLQEEQLWLQEQQEQQELKASATKVSSPLQEEQPSVQEQLELKALVLLEMVSSPLEEILQEEQPCVQEQEQQEEKALVLKVSSPEEETL